MIWLRPIGVELSTTPVLVNSGFRRRRHDPAKTTRCVFRVQNRRCPCQEGKGAGGTAYEYLDGGWKLRLTSAASGQRSQFGSSLVTTRGTRFWAVRGRSTRWSWFSSRHRVSCTRGGSETPLAQRCPVTRGPTPFVSRTRRRALHLRDQAGARCRLAIQRGQEPIARLALQSRIN